MTPERQALQARLTMLLDLSLSITEGEMEGGNHFGSRVGAAKETLTLLSGTVSTLKSLATLFEQELDNHKVSGSITGSEDSDLRDRCLNVVDLAHMASIEIGDLHSKLKSALEGGRSRQSALCARAGLGRVRSALIPIESAFRAYDGLPEVRPRWENLGTSLQIRRAYAVLWHSAEIDGCRSLADIQSQLRMSKIRIEDLQQANFFSSVRIEDQLAFTALDERITAHLKGNSGENPRGLQKEIFALFNVLRVINKRHDLYEHDLRLTKDLKRDAACMNTESRIPRKILLRLLPLFGRDDELDRLMTRPHDYTIKALVAVLGRLNRELEGGGAKVALAIQEI